ncbi:MAG: MBL fold metallo-hydrolase [Chloroflexi bacterium]|nr:MBL fold metallo-hydrolase [Chloroflexota bacterium]
MVIPSDFGAYHIERVAVGDFKSNTYLVRHAPSAQAILIDPGGDPRAIGDLVERDGLSLHGIFLTHGHFDHLSAVAALNERFGVPCCAHEAERQLIRRAPTYALRLAGHAVEVPRKLQLFEAATQILKWGDQEVRVLPVAGHTPGSVCYALAGVIFTGDALLYRHFGPTDYPDSDRQQLQKAVKLLIESLPEETVIFPGHGRPWSVSEARTWLSETDID